MCLLDFGCGTFSLFLLVKTINPHTTPTPCCPVSIVVSLCISARFGQTKKTSKCDETETEYVTLYTCTFYNVYVVCVYTCKYVL